MDDNSNANHKQTIIPYKNLRKFREVKEKKFEIINLKRVMERNFEIFSLLFEYYNESPDRYVESEDDIPNETDEPDELKRVPTTQKYIYKNKKFMKKIATGFYKLDEKIKGFQPGDLIIVAGRPNMGKTSFCLDIAKYAAIQRKCPVLIYLLGMSQEQIGFKMICSEMKINSSLLFNGYFPEKSWSKVFEAFNILSDLPIYIDDSSLLTMGDIEYRAQRIKSEKNIKMIILDYIQLITKENWWEMSRNRFLLEISKELKGLANKLKLPIIVISQLGIEVDERSNKKPRITDLRGIGQYADFVLFIHNPQVYREKLEYNKKITKRVAKILIRKNRNGAKGDIELDFYNKYKKFENLT